MKKALSVLTLACAALSAAAPPARAQTTSSTRARLYDVQRLQDDLAVLDDSLATVPTDHPRYREFQNRADALQSDLARLRDDMQRGSRSSRDLAVSADEVNRLRTRIRELQNDIDTSLNRRWTGTGSVVLPEGTELTVRLERPLSSRTAHVEDRVEATVARPVYVDGRMVVPAGARVLGTVTQVEPAQKPVRGGRLNISFDRLTLDDGTTVDLRSRVVQVKEDIVNSETAKRGAIGAALGAVLGKVLGGTKGALIGILLGGAGGVITAQGDDVELPEGTVFTLQLERPATVLRR
jgi:type IV secretory pathway VirB10-like protein